MFDLCQNKEFISSQDLTNMLINMPDIGFSNCQNIYIPDKLYQNIKNSVIHCVQMKNLDLKEENMAKQKD